MTQRKGSWMQTYTGKAYWPADPRPEDVDIRDIAHHLAMLCRYTGAVPRFYSVAEHSVIVSRLVPRADALAGLLHDATEAYLGDLNRPAKHGPGMVAYRAIEGLNWLAIADHFGLAKEHPESVQVADGNMLFHERAALLPGYPEGMSVRDWGMGVPRPDVLRADLVRGWSWQDAKRFFMQRYLELTA